MKKFYSFIVIACLLIGHGASAGIVSGKKFVRVITAPTITSFSPATGPVGTLVTITGTALSSPTAFTIGGAAAIVVSNTGTTLVGMVMPGAVTGGVSVTTSGGAASGAGNFTVKYTGFPLGHHGAIISPSDNIGRVGGRPVVSADGNTALVGSAGDNNNKGAAWVFKRSGDTWTQQGSKLIGTGGIGEIQQGSSVALSADGNTAMVGGLGDNGFIGAVWVFTRSGDTWTQQGGKLVGTGSSGTPGQGQNVALSADGNTAVVAGLGNNGALWVFTRSAGVWSQQGSKLVGSGAVPGFGQGVALALSADGNTFIESDDDDNNGIGACWIFSRSGTTWSQQGGKLVGTGAVGSAFQGASVALSADGNTALIGGSNDNRGSNGGLGATWVFTRSAGVWTQQGNKLVGSGSIGSALKPVSQGNSVSLSADGNTAVIVGPADNNNKGALWTFTRNAGVWTQQGEKLTGNTSDIALRLATISADGTTTLVAANSATQYGFVAFTSNASTNADLSALATSAGAISPVFATGSLSYTATVANSVTSVTVTPTSADTAASIKVNGESVARGSVSPPIVLAVGTNNINVVVTAQDAFTQKTYTITVTRQHPALPAAPAITSFSPASGPVGTLVKITGTNLGDPTAFTIGGVPAIVVSNSGTLLIGMVMPGTATGPVSISTSEGTASSGSNFSVIATKYPLNQQEGIITPSGNAGSVSTGLSAVSADGNTAIIGSYNDNNGQGAAWVFVRSGGLWTQQGSKLTGAGGVLSPGFGGSAAISADGNTVIIGGAGDNGSIGAAWVFTRSGGAWTQQGSKLVGTGAVGTPGQARTVSLSADGNTALIGGSGDNGNLGAAWVFTRNAGVWTQRGKKLVGSDSSLGSQQTTSIALSADGNTAIIGGPNDNSGKGASWIFVKSGTTWSQQGGKLIGTGAVGAAYQGFSTAISADGNTVIAGGIFDNGSIGAAWVFTRSGGIWSQQGNKVAGSGGVGNSQRGSSVALSADGNTAIVGGVADNNSRGAAWVFTRTAGVWTQRGAKLSGNPAGTTVKTVSISADGNTTIAPTGAGFVVFLSSGAANADLSGLSISQGILSPVFSSNVTSYTTTVDNAATSIKITPTLSDVNATIQVNGTTVASGSASAAIPLSVGSNAITTIVKAQNGTTTKTYTVNVTRLSPSSPVATTSSATLVDVVTATLNGEVQDNGAAVTASFNYGTTPTLTGTTTTVAATTGGTISPGAGTTAVSVDLTHLIANQQYYFRVAITNAGTTTYGPILSFTTLPSRNAILSDLSVSAGTLYPVFDQQTTNYSFSVPSYVKSIAVTPTTLNALATVKVNGVTVASGAPSADIDLAAGSNVITTIVTAQNGTTTKTYTINVTRITGPPLVTTLNATLITTTSATLNGNAEDNGYSTIVKYVYGTSPTLSGASSTTGSLLGTSPTIVPINITGLLTGTKYYYRITATNSLGTSNGGILNFTTLPSANARLSGLSVSTGTFTPTFDSETTSYLVLAPSATSISVTPTTTSGDATVKVNGATVLSGHASASIPLSSGDNTITTIVTAQDGSTTKTYTILVKTAPLVNPVATTLSATAVDVVTATLNGQVQDKGLAATVSFVYGTSPDLSGTTNTVAATTGGTISAGSGTTATSVNVKALLSDKQYYFRVVANSLGIITNGDIHSFTTLPSRNAILSGLSVSTGTLYPDFEEHTINYSFNVPNATTNITVRPTTSNAFATVKVNGTTVVSGSFSSGIPLSVGNNAITTIVTAQDGTTTKTYTINVTRLPAVFMVATTLSASSVDVVDATLNGQVQDNGLSATVSFIYGTSPTLSGTTTTVVATTGGTISAGAGTTAVAVNLTNLLSNRPYYFRVAATRLGTTTYGAIHSFTTVPSHNALLSALAVSEGTLSPSFGQHTSSYTVSVPNEVAYITVKPTTSNAFATVETNGFRVIPGSFSTSLPLSVGNNTVNVVVAAQDGTTIKTYTIVFNRASGSLNATYYNVLQKEENLLPPTDDNVVVHQALSPNGDGVNDMLAVDGIGAYPDNTLTILNRNGVVVYETKGYDNGSKAFDGHSNKTGAMQQAGTYFYTLDYNSDGKIKHKTGYIILKY